ncbi:efflux RND transporter permease subunit [Undibacterium cyanobacteriorum]|uniref:Efflux RND transporter permease subunit n=1 Tax=Undibacterium cyanobacteriorum TaxID=3073561 RepID=A0ABY9RG47_9BURK|nr:efflux RND transporter permease subunit [Undibacterium sp. 20NA77.5]WMW79834.1 efflux RND transporter permease subunit [Undibacterium sp. 20NA77.5]
MKPTQQINSKAQLGISGRIAGFFQMAQITPLLALVALLLGIFAVLVTPREEEPQINVTMANVLIPFPGASVKDVEQMVTVPAEQVLSQIANVEHVMSVSRPGLAIITVQFEVGVPRTEALVRLYDTVHSHRDWLPANLGTLEPLIKPKGIDDVPIVSFTLWSQAQGQGALALEQVAHSVEAELKRVKGTREITTIGGPGRAIQIALDPAKLAAHQLTVLDLQAALQAANLGLPTGELTAGNRTVAIEAGPFLQDAQSVAELVVAVRNNRPVYLQDVAQIEDGALPITQYVWHGEVQHGQTSKAESKPASATTPGAASGTTTETTSQTGAHEYPAVTIAVTKKPGQNAVQVADAVISRMESLKGTVIPADVEVKVSRNYGQTADDKAKKLIQKLLFATLSVVALVFIALGRREAAIVGTAVILTLTVTLFASWAWGFTLNRVSLFALIFSIGILVDDAIVVVENIHRHQALFPDKRLVEIIPGAVDEVGGPTILATLTVIAALLPMAFVSGLMGPYMSPIPINASMGMLLSLAIAFIVTPWLARLWMKEDHHSEGGIISIFRAKLAPAFQAVFRPFLDQTRGAKNRAKLGLGVLALIGLSVLLPVLGWVQLKMLPFDNKSEFQVIVDMPAGTPVEKTAAVLRELGNYLQTVPEVSDYQAYAGTAAPINFNGLVRQYYLRADSEMGDLQVNLVDKHHRSDKSHAIAMRVRPQLQALARKIDPNANVKVVEVPPGPPVLAPIVAEIYGPGDVERRQLAKQVRAVFEKSEGIVDVDDSSGFASPRKLLIVDRKKAAQLGISQVQIVTSLRMGLHGEAAAYLHDQSKYPASAYLQLPNYEQGNLDTLLALTVRSAQGKLVPIRELVTVTDTEREQALYHKDGLAVNYVVADMAGKLDSPLYGMFKMRNDLHKIVAPSQLAFDEFFIQQPNDVVRQYSLKWDGEWQVTYETFRDMGAAYAVGLVLIYLLVVAQFGSYLTPLIIMAPIPLTIIGVMPGHALLGAQYTATSMIGMIALAGIIVRNSILLVDFIHVQVAQGIAFKEAVVQSAITRAQPIALTGLAAMMGAFFILDDPIFNGLAISLIFGIFVSTLLTLVVIPLLYFVAYRGQYEVQEEV